MEITKEMLEERRDILVQQRQEFLNQANACNGALEDVEYWLDILSQPSRERDILAFDKNRMDENFRSLQASPRTSNSHSNRQ